MKMISIDKIKSSNSMRKEMEKPEESPEEEQPDLVSDQGDLY